MMSHMSNPLVTPLQLAAYRSSQPGQRPGKRAITLTPDIQDAAHFAMQVLTQAAGRLLELPQSATATACVLLSRYWVSAASAGPGAEGGGGGGRSQMDHEFSVCKLMLSRLLPACYYSGRCHDRLRAVGRVDT